MLMNNVCKILLVDDDRLVLATVSSGLRDHGYDVVTAASGEDVLEQVNKERPDLVLLDMRMPGLSGVETARLLKQQNPVPFVFLSAYGDAKIVQEAAEEGAFGYLVKPIDVAKMIPTIEAALARARDLDGSRQREGHLQQALAQGRETSMAVGLVMERYRLNREQAFDALRVYARTQRRKLEEVALELLEASERSFLPVDIVERARNSH
jgi:response regulator NasT